jgi:hypothetical protein
MLVNVLLGSWAWADAMVQSVSGDVRLEMAGTSAPLAIHQAISRGSVVHTGTNGQVVLRFDDGQMAAVGSVSSLRVDEHNFDASRPEQGSSKLSLLKGALRVVTGLIGQSNPQSFVLSTPNATLGVRGTDFMVVVANPVYLTVNQGAIVATNRAGSQIFAAGAMGVVTARTSLAKPIAATSVPESVSATFSRLRSVDGLSGGAGVTGKAGQGSGDGRKRDGQTEIKKAERNDRSEKEKRQSTTDQGERAVPSKDREGAERSDSGPKTERRDRIEATEKVDKVDKVEKVE